VLSSPPVKRVTAVSARQEPQSISADIPPFRQHKGQIARQLSVLSLGAIFITVAGDLFKVHLLRVLGAEALGIYALDMTNARRLEEIVARAPTYYSFPAISASRHAPGLGCCPKTPKCRSASVCSPGSPSLGGDLCRHELPTPACPSACEIFG
jgi:hypothetical protein